MRGPASYRYVVATAVGALLAYLLDPVSGRGRRHRLRDMALARGRRVLRRTERKARYAEGRLKGAQERAVGHGSYEPASQPDLREHLRQVIAELDFPTTDVTVDVADGIATLRGQVRTPEQVRTVRAAVAEVEGVDRVESYLHLPGTPAPNKADARNTP